MADKISKTKLRIVDAISTIWGLGKLKYAPGTLGSIFACFLCFLWVEVISDKFGFMNIANIILFLVVLFFIGVWSSEVHSKQIKKDDPGEIIIDEVVGQAMTTAVSFPFAFTMFFLAMRNEVLFEYQNIVIFVFFYLVPLILFRLFDILKPWPVCWFDRNVKGGLGIMLDDIVASIMAILTYALIWAIVTRAVLHELY